MSAEEYVFHIDGMADASEMNAIADKIHRLLEGIRKKYGTMCTLVYMKGSSPSCAQHGTSVCSDIRAAIAEAKGGTLTIALSLPPALEQERDSLREGIQNLLRPITVPAD